MTTRRILGTFLALTTVYGASIAAAQRATDTPGPTITVVGCVQRTDQPGTPGTVPERTPPPQTAGTPANLGDAGPGFVLTNAMPAPAGAATEPAAGSPKTEAPKRFVLFGNESELGKHEGHRVKVSGMVEPSTKPAESGATATSGSSQPKSDSERLKVTSIEMIAGDCTPR